MMACFPRNLLRYFLSRNKRAEAGKAERPVHIIFCTVDHYEPGTRGADRQVETSRVDSLVKAYPDLAKRHKDSAGNMPKRTWFLPPHYHRYHTLRKLAGLCAAGYGEIELHIHHGKIAPDTSDNLEATINLAVKEYSRFGCFGSENGRKRYGFIHGDWALDNSRGGKYCGVNNEIDILIRTGCYADFTFPSLRESDPAMVNSIYYAADDPLRPRSHDSGIAVSRCGKRRDGLMIIEGPLCPVFMAKGALEIGMTGGGIDSRRFSEPLMRYLLDSWVKAGVHLEGQPDIIFIKSHMHGAAGDAEESDKRLDLIYDHLENSYNDGSRYVLHYATARQMYNIIKAIESGKCTKDNIDAFRDYSISAPVYDPSPEIAGASEELAARINKTYG